MQPVPISNWSVHKLRYLWLFTLFPDWLLPSLTIDCSVDYSLAWALDVSVCWCFDLACFDHALSIKPEIHQSHWNSLKSSHVTADRPESRHITANRLESGHFLSVALRFPKSVRQYPRLASSVEDSPLVSAGATGIPKPTHSSPPVPELISLSEALPMMRIALWCVWAAYIHYDFSRGGDWCCRTSRGSGARSCVPQGDGAWCSLSRGGCAC